MRLARSIGIDVPEIQLVHTRKISGLPGDLGNLEGEAFAIKRFDRNKGGTKNHIEDFAQIFGLYPESKYEKANYQNIASVIWSECGQEDTAEFIKRFIFCSLIGNGDMHLKNWSLI